MTVEIKGNKLCIEIDLEKPTPSASGKTLVVASSTEALNAITASSGIFCNSALFSTHLLIRHVFH
jgi:hypothetical protein